MSRKKDNKHDNTVLKQELKEFQQQGVTLLLEGNLSTPKEIAKACKVEEEGSYMRDYVTDEKGVVREVRFDLVRKKE